MRVAYQAAGGGQIWHKKKKYHSSEDVSHRGLRTNVAREWCPWLHQKTLSCSGHWPNVAKKWCPSSEDFVSLTKCGPNCAPRWRTLSRSGLQPNVVQSVPLVGGLCLTADFDQMWSKHVPLVRGLCHTVDFDRIWSKHVPLDRWLHFATEFYHIWINNMLIIEESWHQTNRSLTA